MPLFKPIQGSKYIVKPHYMIYIFRTLYQHYVIYMNSMIKSMDLFLVCFTSIVLLMATSTALNTISLNQTIRDGVTSIESADGVFELGFFSPLKSKKRYLGIWYKKISIKTIVWVANRETPLNDTSGILRINENGVLVLMDGTDGLIWSSNSSKTANNPVAELLDNGNLVIRYENDTDSNNLLWQSFDHPADNLLSGMKIGWDFEKRLDRSLTSWKSSEDPSPGKYRLSVNLDGFPQVILWKGLSLKLRFGPWDGIQFSGVSVEAPDIRFEVITVFNAREIYSSFEFDNNINAMRMMLTPDGDIQFLRWINQTQDWKLYFAAPRDECDHFAVCGGYGNCNITNSRPGHGACTCLKGFKPKYPGKWKLGDSSNGCVRKTQLACGNGDGFVKYSGLKLPDTRSSWFNRSMNHDECESLCLLNCSCTAYSYLDIRQGGIGCLLWFNELLDIRDYNVIGLDLYVKVAASEYAANGSSSAKRLRRALIIVVIVLLTVVLCVFIGTVCKKTKVRRKGTLTVTPESGTKNGTAGDDMDLPLFDFEIIANATDNFSQRNKIGEGGFGPVYKGIMDGGQELAVKRLSKDSSQGLDEFKNEVSLISKLQHRNLVRLLGCCIEEGEMLLIYEYMPNKSLDSFIFDKDLSKSLNWRQRYDIIGGIARGILYLHQDSRLRIIHRDLKLSNILLDFEMNPRISDFGMARSFGGSGRLTNTTRVVGTFGYMSPEYALDGIFSVKSDVYSFGVIVLEIISGKKVKGFYQSDPSLNLLGRAWRLYKDDRLVELLSADIEGNCNPLEVFRVIQIGLLCVQPHPEDRPSMSSVVLMLSSETDLPEPKQPGFFTDRISLESDSSTSNLQELFVSSRLTSSYLGPR